VKHSHRILVAFGTRPEAIKLVPVINALRSSMEGARVCVVATSQHRDLVDPILRFFDIHVDHDLDIMTDGQGPGEVTARVLSGMAPVLDRERPELVIVQGDTSSAMAAAMATFYRQIPVAHVEAGLRTGDRYQPFPEEVNRRLLAQLATLHYAPTETNRRNLLREGIADEAIVVAGNTVIDTLSGIVDSGLEHTAEIPLRQGTRLVLLTTHRRENFGAPQRNIFEAVNDLLERNEEIEVVFPVHPNPRVIEAVREHLRPHERLHTVAPLSYIDFIALMSRAYVVLSDSGGVQEEAPALGTPVLILRTSTERGEVLSSGNAMLVPLEREPIVDTVERLLNDRSLRASMAQQAFPFGSGGASERIARHIARFLDASST
jgi:UDP-N-acetylglucosamine 2-epimerase (non-hydrolysing)